MEGPASSEDSFRTAKDESVDVFDFIADIFKFVDDTTVVEAVDLSRAIKHYTTAQSTSQCKARYTELIAGAITERADEIGMKVNCKKTQLLMVSQPNGYVNSSYINLEDQKIESSSSLKLLGFHFGTEPTVSKHVQEIKRKFRSRLWSLIHLRRAGFKGSQLFKMYCVFIRPVIEFCSVVYHSMLTVTQSEELERIQRQVTKLCFGWEKS